MDRGQLYAMKVLKKATLKGEEEKPKCDMQSFKIQMLGEIVICFNVFTFWTQRSGS